MVKDWLHEAVCRHRYELWRRVCYKKLCVDRNMNCGGGFITRSFVQTET